MKQLLILALIAFASCKHQQSDYHNSKDIVVLIEVSKGLYLNPRDAEKYYNLKIGDSMVLTKYGIIIKKLK